MNEPNTNPNIYDTSIRLLFLALIIGWCLMILLPFTSIILWGFILGIAFRPLHSRMAKIMGGRPKLASFIIVLACLAVFIVPAWLLLDSLLDNAKELRTRFLAGSLTIPPPSASVKNWPVIGEKIHGIWSLASTDLGQTVIKYKSEIVGIGGKIAKGLLSVGGGILQLFVALIIAGVLLSIPGTEESVRKVARKLAEHRGDEFGDIVKITVGNVVKGCVGGGFHPGYFGRNRLLSGASTLPRDLDLVGFPAGRSADTAAPGRGPGSRLFVFREEHRSGNRLDGVPAAGRFFG